MKIIKKALQADTGYPTKSTYKKFIERQSGINNKRFVKNMFNVFSAQKYAIPIWSPLTANRCMVPVLLKRLSCCGVSNSLFPKINANKKK